jgi:hypothetical protein
MATRLQQKAVKKLAENGRSVSAVMREVGYSPETAKVPGKLTNSKGYKELMDEIIPDKFLTKKHKELLSVPKKIRKFIKGDLMDEYEELDTQAISKGLDMAYKVKGHYAVVRADITSGDKPIPLFDFTKKDVRNNDSDQENPNAKQADQGDPGRDIGQQDGIDNLIPD